MSNSSYTSRFSDAPWLLPKGNKQVITVGGAGGIGSWVLLFLARTGNAQSIMLYEFDTIDETNMAGQFFRVDQVGISKANAIRNNVSSFCGFDGINCFGEFSLESGFVTPITISGFDNMKARREMFEAWKKLEDRELFIDGRMIFEDGQIYTVTKGREEEYEATLFDDKDVDNGACSMKATTHCGAHIASIMISILNNYFANKYKDDIREVPFKYIFSLGHLITEIYD